jgi:ubiquinone/menaquinone biosynthesis C-methylase UbiE
MDKDKQAVREFWEEASCGEKLYLSGHGKEDFLKQAEIRYDLEPYIFDFAEFHRYNDQKVLEIGVGLGADHQQFAEAGAKLFGVDLTKRAIYNTHTRFQKLGLKSELSVVDAEKLPFNDNYFDLVYSWGVLHVTPNTAKAIDEVHRVLKPEGQAKIMIYHKYSMVGYMLWLRYALFKLRPWTPLKEIYYNHLESKGTKAYTIAEARELFHKFRKLKFKVILTHGDLLTSSAGQRHEGPILSVAKIIWPRLLIRKFFSHHGLFLTILGSK